MTTVFDRSMRTSSTDRLVSGYERLDIDVTATTSCTLFSDSVPARRETPSGLSVLLSAGSACFACNSSAAEKCAVFDVVWQRAPMDVLE